MTRRSPPSGEPGDGFGNDRVRGSRGRSSGLGSPRPRGERPPAATGLLAIVWTLLLGGAPALVAAEARRGAPGGEPATADADDSPETEPGPGEFGGVTLGPFDIRGAFRQRYRYRTTASDSDQDLYGYLDLEGDYPGRVAGEDASFGRLGFQVQMNYNLDIDSFERLGGAGGDVFLPFSDITNTFPDRFVGFVQSAFVEGDDVLWFEKVRLGRQDLFREEGVLFDGGLVRSRRWNTVALEVYGGLPAHLYETSASGDAFGGAGVDVRPLAGLNLGADYYYLKDHRRTLTDSENHYWLIRGRYRIDREWMVRAYASWTEDRDRRQFVEVRHLSEWLGLLAHLRLLRQNSIVEQQVDEVSPFIYVVGRYAPFYQMQLDLHQPIGSVFGVGGGVNLRQLDDESDKGQFNHSFQNYYLALDLRDLWPAMTASLRGDAWNADRRDIYSVSLELEQRILEDWRVRAGTSFSLYRLDPFTGEERERDRVYYLKLLWKLLRHVELEVEYQFERDSITEYHNLISGVRVWF